jgi:signal transduction histidine kinase
VRRAAGRTTALNERFLRRFSAELHDGPVQDLSLAVLELDNLIVTCAATPDAAAYVPRLEAIEQTVRRGLQDVRSTSAGLLLPHLGQLSVADTARHAARAHERRSKVPVTLELEHAPERAGLATKISVYRVCQEALTNAARHAPGAAPHVRVAGDDGQLTVSIADAGSGFDAANMLASDEHLGLVGMRERVESLGGTLCIESAAQAGTTVLARLPLEPDLDEAGFVQSREVAHG